ncbi:MAG: citrate/2-methylcitrate synthase, partial [Eubacteriales bacterium]|nr:citrate/2-methylcitrate synthase [Eubacteriales bacterium]
MNKHGLSKENVVKRRVTSASKDNSGSAGEHKVGLDSLDCPTNNELNVRGSKQEAKYLAAMSSEVIKNNGIDSAFYSKFDVKRGLRNANGTGVVVGLTKVGEVRGYKTNEQNEKVAIEGKLYYRGVDVEDLVKNCIRENRFGFEETCYLLLFGSLPTKNELCDFTATLAARRELPMGFARDMILVAPSNNVMNKLARSVLALYSYDENADDVS